MCVYVELVCLVTFCDLKLQLWPSSFKNWGRLNKMSVAHSVIDGSSPFDKFSLSFHSNIASLPSSPANRPANLLKPSDGEEKKIDLC